VHVPALKVLKDAAKPLVFLLKCMARGLIAIGLLAPTGPMPREDKPEDKPEGKPDAPPAPGESGGVCESAVPCPVEVVSSAALTRDEQLWEGELAGEPGGY